MAPKSAFVLAVLLLLSSSAASERLQPEWAAGCWNEICQVPDCLFSILKAFFPKTGGSAIDGVSVPCCSAFLTLTEDCQVEIFQNSSVITLIQTFCSAIVPPAPVAPGPGTSGDMPWPWPNPPAAAPAPGNDRDMPWPWMEPPPAAPEADADSSLSWSTVRFV